MSTPRYQHLRFHVLKIGEDFFYRKYRYYKYGFFTGRTILDGELVVIMPWVKVRSARPFGKQLPSPYPTQLQTLTGKGPTVNA